MKLQGHTNTVKAACFSQDGRLALKAPFDRTARIWDVATGACKRVLATLQGIPDEDWYCISRENVRPKGTTVTQQITLGLVQNQTYYGGIAMPTISTAQFPCLLIFLLNCTNASIRKV
jgi:WD40 repeat protein